MPETPAPALGYSILANLGDEKQITVQCFADSEEELASIHAKIDRAMAVIDRQKAKYQIRDLERELEKMERALRQLEEDLDRLETEFEANQAAIDNRIAEAGAAAQGIVDAAYARGRGKPVGADAAHANALRKEMEGLKEQKAKALAERAQARANLATSVGRYREEIEKTNGQLAECRALVDGG